ncbi:MAG: Crp/Fnr family transcriptional regulator [Gemmatimonadaceae bacterium]|nr:Crp/Fnr family transcriptional regulator [Gemmatimonadaceae bacterium]
MVSLARNRILEALPELERAALWAVAREKKIPSGTEILAANSPFSHVYFPETAVFSLVTDLVEGNSVESGTVGFEGFVGLPVFFGGESSPQRTIVQIPGVACVLTADAFRKIVGSLPSLDALLKRYALAFIAQISQTAACNSQHSILQRCARWILLTHDRVGSNDILLTQEFLAYMLGVRRPSVTVAEADLKSRELIGYSRGRMQVLDRAGLEAISCECHGAVRREFEKLTGAAVG